MSERPRPKKELKENLRKITTCMYLATVRPSAALARAATVSDGKKNQIAKS